jgi:urea transport system permease protein
MSAALARLLLVALLFAAGAVPAMAQDGVEADVRALAEAGFAEKTAIVGRLASTGDARIAPLLDALLAGDLYALEADGRIVVATPAEGGLAVRDALTGEELGTLAAADLSRIAVNNRLRGAIRGALGTLTLANPDPARRREAATALFRTRPAEMAEPVEQALAAETVPEVRTQLERTLAAIRIAAGGDDPGPRIAAAETLAAFPEPDVRALLAGVAEGDEDEGVRAAASSALSAMDRSIAAWSIAASVFQGISLGSVLLLAAVGLAITFGVMRVINMAHGEMVMLGAYTTYVVQEAFRAVAPGAIGWSLAVAVPAAFLVAGAIGVAIERGIIRTLYGRTEETLLATWGLSLILQQTVRTVFGPTNRQVSTPDWMSGSLEVAGGFSLTYNRLWIILFSLLVLALIALLFRRTPFGLSVRAVTQNRRMAGSMGINTGRVDALTFALGSGVAGMGGVALSQIDNVSPNLGQSYIIDSFMVVVFGGVGNLLGTLVGAFSLGLVNKFLEPYAGAVLGKILVLVAIILFIQKRPRGLFALKGRAAEA